MSKGFYPWYVSDDIYTYSEGIMTSTLILGNYESLFLILEKAMATHSSTLPGKSHGWRSLVGCSPWGCTELDTTERLHFHCSLSNTGEGNGNPLQCSCLENPMDGGAWWAAVHGVAKSLTQLGDFTFTFNSRP